jgi:putative endonuclease
LSKGFSTRPKVLAFFGDDGMRTPTLHVYMLQCADSSYYVGISEDLHARVERHNAGTAAAWTAARLPVKLVHSETFNDLQTAVARETQLKGWSRAKKAALAEGNHRALKSLSRCRTQRAM